MDKSESDDGIEKIQIKRNRKVMEEHTIDHKKAICPICNREITPYWEPRYSGLRATCDECGTNWAES